MVARTRQVKAPATIRHNEAIPPVAQAANIALQILKRTKKPTWKELVADPASCSTVVISAEQRALLEQYADILPYLKAAPVQRGDEAVSVNQTVIACPECGRFAFSGTEGTGTGRCTLTSGCPGAMVRASTVAPPVRKTAAE